MKYREGTVEKNVEVSMSDGVRLCANVYRPAQSPSPVVLSVTPYGKDNTPDRLGMLAMRLAGVRFGHLDCSPLAGFESPDPAFWNAHGYAVVQADARGMHSSGGNAGFLTDRDAGDYAELITWAADQPWSTGRVGLNGVSYLCMSQWRVAALHPRGLAAMVAWEGATDLLREFAYHGGIPETGFLPTWWKNRMVRGSHRGKTMSENFPCDRLRHPVDDDYWAAKRPSLAQITTPALVGASWSDHGLHTRGTLLAYEQLAGPKWLFVHGRRKWEAYYSPEALDLQRRFLDHFLNDLDNGWLNRPRVVYEARRTRTKYERCTRPQWPLRDPLRTLYLDAKTMTLQDIQAPARSHTYRSDARRGTPRFVHAFDVDTEITGGMALTVWMSTHAGDDMDVFVVIRKQDDAGRPVPFFGYNGFPRDGVAKGWLRASHRALDTDRSRPERPFHSHTKPAPMQPDEPTELTVEILPSSTIFEAGSKLVVEILGCDAQRYPVLRHEMTVNGGLHTVHTGGTTPSALTFRGRAIPDVR